LGYPLAFAYKPPTLGAPYAVSHRVERFVLGGKAGRTARKDTLVPEKYDLVRVTATFVRESHATLWQSKAFTEAANAARMELLNFMNGNATVTSEDTVESGSCADCTTEPATEDAS